MQVIKVLQSNSALKTSTTEDDSLRSREVPGPKSSYTKRAKQRNGGARNHWWQMGLNDYWTYLTENWFIQLRGQQLDVDNTLHSLLLRESARHGLGSTKKANSTTDQCDEDALAPLLAQKIQSEEWIKGAKQNAPEWHSNWALNPSLNSPLINPPDIPYVHDCHYPITKLSCDSRVLPNNKNILLEQCATTRSRFKILREDGGHRDGYIPPRKRQPIPPPREPRNKPQSTTPLHLSRSE